MASDLEKEIARRKHLHNRPPAQSGVGPARYRKGRRPGPPRVVVQLRIRSAGKVYSYYSITVYVTPSEAMKRIQEAFAGNMKPDGCQW